MVGVIWPVLLGLMASFRVVEGAEHNDNGDMLVVHSFPKIIVTFDWSLAEDSKNIAINKGLDLIGIDIVVGDVWNFNPAVLI